MNSGLMTPNSHPGPTVLVSDTSSFGMPCQSLEVPFLEPFSDLSFWTVLCRNYVSYTQNFSSSLHIGSKLDPRLDATRPVGNYASLKHIVVRENKEHRELSLHIRFYLRPSIQR